MEGHVDSILDDALLLDRFVRSLVSSLVLHPFHVDGGCYYAVGRRGDYPVDDVPSELFGHLQTLCAQVAANRGVRGDHSSASLPESLLEESALSLYDNIVSAVDKILTNSLSALDMDGCGGDNVYSERFKENTNHLTSKLISLHRVTMIYLAVDRERLLLACTDVIGSENSCSKGLSRDNTLSTPFRPVLTRKVFSIKEEKFELKLQQKKQSPCFGNGTLEEPGAFYLHPYRRELRSLIHPEWQLDEPSVSNPDTSFENGFDTYVSQMSGVLAHVVITKTGEFDNFIDSLEELLASESLREVGLHVATHNYRSFQGSTRWLVISLRTAAASSGDDSRKSGIVDNIIDAVALQSELHRLDLIMANPLILKVMHGSRAGLAAMQRDLGLYVVNCFDICEGAKILRFPMTSINHITRYYGGSPVGNGSLRDWRSCAHEVVLQLQQQGRCLLPLFYLLRRDLFKAGIIPDALYKHALNASYH